MFATTPNATDRQNSEECQGRSPAFRFPAPSPALAILRPAFIPEDVNLYDYAYFDEVGIKGPDRASLVEGLALLNSLEVVSDTALSAIANGSLNKLTMWGYVETGFNSLASATKLFSDHLLSPLITDAFPLKSIINYWLDWHKTNSEVVSKDTLDDLGNIPEIGSGSVVTEVLAGQFPGIYSRNQGRIAQHLNDLSRDGGGSIADELPLTFQSETWSTGISPLIVGGGEMMGVNFGVCSTELSPAYWRAVVHGLRLIGCCLRPMMTPDEIMEFAPVLMEEESDDVEAVLSLLKERDQQPDDEEAVLAALNEVDPFVLDCFGSFQCALESHEVAKDVEDRWLTAENTLTVSGLRELISGLPEPSRRGDASVAKWLPSLIAALPASLEESALYRARCSAVCEGSLDMLVSVFFEDDVAFAEASIQPAYEVFMSDAEESYWEFGWDVSAALMEDFAKGVKAGNKLIDDLHVALSC